MKCKICKKREAEVRDRNDPFNEKKTVCRYCHEQRLRHDMALIIELSLKREKC